jgi:signal transduction histidine kinase
VVGLFRPYRGGFRDFGVENPIAPAALADALNVAGTAALVVLHAGLLGAAVLLLLRFRSAGPGPRNQLRWLALAAIPFPFLVIGAWFAAAYENELSLVLSGGGFVAIVPIAAGLAIEQDHLYDIDRLLSRGLTYALLTAGVIAVYAGIVIALGAMLGGESEWTTILATLVAAGAALPARRWLQGELDRRFNRRRFEAVSAIRAFVRQPSPATTLEEALRAALDDPSLNIRYWIDDRRLWVDAHGNTADSRNDAVIVTRRGSQVAAVELDRGKHRPATIDAVIAEALPEIENARLRAAITLQLVEVRESRARIVAAQVEERHKLERNLHDGAQQRLLAIALQLRAAEVGDAAREMRSTIDDAVRQLQLAVSELRELANGFHPSALSDGGLAVALDDLAARTPVAVRLSVTRDRFPPHIEEAAWYVACEAVTNAVKHGSPQFIDISAAEREGRLLLTIEDDGCGGADPLGNGLRGITDRAEAAGGSLDVRPGANRGTVVTAELPCV